MAGSQLDIVFAALADPSRRLILERLAGGEATVGTIARPLPMALPSVSKHVKVLIRAGLVERQVRGREHWLRLTPAGFRSAADWLAGHQPVSTEGQERTEIIGRAVEAPERDVA